MRRPASIDREAVLAADRAHVWHPYSAVDDPREPLVIAGAKGCWLEEADGRRLLDGNSSWWVASLGHGHPRLLARLREQSEQLVHCALAGITHEPAALLARELAEVAPGDLKHVFYTDNGSTSIEVALRMSLQAWQQRGATKKTRFLALDGAFHGDTLGAASLGGVEIFRRGFAGLALDCVRAPFPAHDAKADDGYAAAFEAILARIRDDADELAAVVVEPVVQGAAGMRIYDPRLLRELRAACDAYDVLLVFDEVFTGYGRTGAMWACDHAGVAPDLMCLGKAFASLLPMGATLANDRVHDAFRGGRERALYYGHTFCGHPLGASLAREVLAIYRDENLVAEAARKGAILARGMERLAALPGVLRTRSLGMVAAADLTPSSGAGGYLGEGGWRVYDEALRRGAYLRPLGDTVYVTPPLVASDTELEQLLAILHESVAAVTAP